MFQVEWDPKHETVLASYADDRRLMVWDLNRYLISQIAAARSAFAFVYLLGYAAFTYFIHPSLGLGMSSWKEMVMMAHQNFSSHMAAIKQRYRISLGINMSHGSFQV